MTDIRYPANDEAIIHNIRQLETISDLNSERVIAIKADGEGQESYINQIFKRKKKDRDLIPQKPSEKQDNIDAPNKRKKVIIISSIVISALLLVIGLCLCLFFVLNKNDENKNENGKKNYQEENLIVKLNYNPNNLLKFRSKKNINLEVNTNESEDNDSNSNENNKKNMIQYTDFIFIIREKKDEKDENNLISKNLYTGYIGILNVTLNNGTNDMMVIYDEQLSKSIKNEKQNNLRNIDEKPDLSYVDEKNKFCFIKIEFYENGEIKNIFLPKNFEVSNMIYINEIIKLIIPKISPKLYSSNIESKIEEILTAKEEEYNLNLTNMTDIFNSTDLINNIRLLSNDSNDEDSMTYDQYISPSSSSSSKSNDVELRQIIKNENSSIEDGDFINLTEYAIYDLKNDLINFEENYLKKIIYTKIDHSGNLYSVKEIQSSIMHHDNNFESEEDEGKLEQVYNENNMISIEDVVSEDEENNKNKFNFDLSNIIYETTNDIELTWTLTFFP